MTLALAIWGAVTGTIGALVSLLAHVRDRPRLALTLSPGVSRQFGAEIVVDVQNRGRQATTIMRVALAPDGEVEIQKDGVTVATGTSFELRLDDEHPKVVMPGEVAQFGISLPGWPGPIHADEPLRLYVLDSHGQRTWGSAAAVLRVLLNSGWRPPSVDPRVLTPLPGAPIRPKPVEPQWKLWKPKEFRKPSLPPPPAWPHRSDDVERN